MANGIVTLGDIRTQSQQRADMVNSGFLTTTEWNQNLSSSYKELYDLLIQKFGNDYYVQTPFSITTDGVNDKFALPVDFYKLLGVDCSVSGSTQSFITLKPFMFSERNRYAVPNFQSFYGLTNLRYRLLGNNLFLTPLPTAGQLLKVYYVQRPVDLLLDTDTMDGVSGWEEYVIVDGAIKALEKEESDVSILMAQKQALIKRIEEAAENRDAGSPQTVSDNQGNWGPFGRWTDGSGSF